MLNRRVLFTGMAAAAIIAPLVGLYYLWKRPLPIIRGRLKLKGLHARVEVVRDKWGVPHIYAQNDEDVFFAQGFVHAQDRLWHMELNRRLAGGRLSEMVGEAAFGTDRLMRIVGLHRAAKNDWMHASEETVLALNAYARGVNAFLETNRNKLPLEFTLLRFSPEPWRPLDTLVWIKIMAWGQGLNWDAELLRAAVLDKLGPERTAKLLGDDISLTNPIVLNHTPIPGFDRLVTELREAKKFLGVTTPLGMSNNWVADGSKTVTGKPLLANDPHLPLQMPSLWYEAHLNTPEWQAAGVSLPGVPLIVLGHNAEIAWGVTNAFVDTQDLYIEQFDPQDPTRYRVGDSWQKAEVIREEIQVKGEKAPRMVDVTVTRHGPIMNEWWEPLRPKAPVSPGAPLTPLMPRDDALLDGTRVSAHPPAPVGRGGTEAAVHMGRGEVQGLKLALRWVGYDASRAVGAGIKLMCARNWAEFRDALRDWTEPALSFVYADRAGNIGYQLAGNTPVRKNGKGATPVPGWNDEYAWTGLVPFDELPHVFNPPEHLVVTANNRVVGKEYKHHLSLDTMNGFRAKRILDLIKAQEKLSADDYARIQKDVYCIPAETFQRLTRAFFEPIVTHPSLHGRGMSAREALKAIDGWDCQLTADSVAGAIYETTLYFAMERLYRPWLGDLTTEFIGVGFHPLLHPVGGGTIDRAYLIALRILENEETEWMVEKDAQSELVKRLTSVDILAQALNEALQFLEMNVAFDMRKWQWGKLHRATFQHALGAVKPLDKLFNRGPFPFGGDTSTVWQAGFVPQMPIPDDGSFSASWRQIMDVSDWDASRGVHPTGQSGHPASRHYADQMALWFQGEHHPLLWSRGKILEHQEGVLYLE